MIKNKPEFNANYFVETKFELLMRKRINTVLLICSSYDAFILNQDGRIEEQIFNEYVALNLRHPPEIIHVFTSGEALEIIRKRHIDLIITMLSVGDMDPFVLAKKVKARYPRKPIVVLTPFVRNVSFKLSNDDLSAIDYVFSWLGDARIMLAIIKLIEDKMNAPYDVNTLGVQSIILVEDSVRYYSSYLPTIYKIIFTQSKKFMHEGLNEHQKMMRMRGRPKILLATNYEQALRLYNKYRRNLLGVISDIAYPRKGVKDKKAGIRLCKKIKKEDKYLPLLLQSSEESNVKYTNEIGVSFVHKYSKNLHREITEFITEYFSFQDFIFIDPDTEQPIFRAKDLKGLQEVIYDIPDQSMIYHLKRNHFSKWLNARALFPVAEVLKNLEYEDFNSVQHARDFLNNTISNYRSNKSRGVIAQFYKEKYDNYLIFARIGQGSIGGKARGLAFIDQLIKNKRLENNFDGVNITIPRTVVLSTDIFDNFMESNDLYKTALSNLSDDIILKTFIDAELSADIIEDLKILLALTSNPIAIRSSSLLEDSHYQPFAGVYSTYMIANKSEDKDFVLIQLQQAIKSVYASVFYKQTKDYMRATSNVIDEEKMGVILQEVCGKQYGDRFYPTISGVARSVNFYPLEYEKAEDGIANVALGLGKQIVEGGKTIRFSPKFPQKILQLSSPDMALRDTQKTFFALNMDESSFIPSTDEGVNLLKLRVKEADKDQSIKHIASTFDYQNNIIRDGANNEGKKLITFANVLKYNTFPLAQILEKILSLFEKEMNNPVEIEFAVNLEVPKSEPKIFNILQIRPIVEGELNNQIDIERVLNEETIISSNLVLGNGSIKEIRDIVYVKTENFNAKDNPLIALDIEKINAEFINKNKNYVLVGPGRWGSHDSWLGIPVLWSQISAARLIVESGLSNYRIDPSQGTHFFQNLTAFHVGYFTINPYTNDGYYDLDFLAQSRVIFENEFIRHIQFDEDLDIKLDSRKNKGVVMKPKSNKN